MRDARLLALAFSLLVPAVAAGGVVLRQVDAAKSGVTFENLCGSHTAKIFIIEQLGGGGALFDYDFDGDLDLYLVNGADVAIVRGEKPPVKNALYRNDGGWRFVDVTDRAGVGDPRWGVGATVGDADGDGDLDLYVTNFGPNLLYENLGDGTFRDVSAAAGIEDPGMGASAAFGDVDGDGDLDLYVVNYTVLDLDDPPKGGELCDYQGILTACGPIGLEAPPDVLFRNDGGLRFTDVSGPSGIHAVEPQYGLGLILGDYDDDGLLDIFVANDSGPNFSFHNVGGGKFEDEAWLSGFATQSEGRFQAGMGIDLGDVDGDGQVDVFMTNFADDHNTLYMNRGGGLYEDTSYPSGVGAPSYKSLGWGTRFVDFDLDSDLDLYVANGHIYPEVDGDGRESFRQPDQLYLNDGTGRFSEASEGIVRSTGTEVSRGIAAGDVDLDGDVDLVVFEMGSRPSLLENATEGAGHFLVLDPRNTGGVSTAFGTRVWVEAGGRRQRREVTPSGSYATASDPRAHFGLGSATSASRVEVVWPGGKRRVIEGLAADRRWVVPEP